MQWQVQDFSRPQGGGVREPSIIWQFFCRKLHEIGPDGVPSAQPHPWIRLCLYTRMEYFAVDKLIFN